eukprot:52199-Chlamydomonas_euryale.AAC.1
MVPPGPPRPSVKSHKQGGFSLGMTVPHTCAQIHTPLLPDHPRPVLGPHKCTSSPEQRPVKAEREVKEDNGQRRREGKEGGR